MTNQIRLGAIFWLLTVEFFIAQFVAQASWAGYSIGAEDISNLGLVCGIGETCSPLNLVFNLGMFANGVLVALGAWFTRKLWPASALTTAALWILMIGGGVGSMMVGLFPVNANPSMHMVGAVLALFIACFGIIALGVVNLLTRRAFAIYTIATGLLTLVAFVLYVLTIYLGLGRGIMERIAAWPHTIWYMVTGALILREYFSRSD